MWLTPASQKVLQKTLHKTRDYILQCSNFENISKIFVSEQNSQMSYQVSTEVKKMNRITDLLARKYQAEARLLC